MTKARVGYYLENTLRLFRQCAQPFSEGAAMDRGVTRDGWNYECDSRWCMYQDVELKTRVVESGGPLVSVIIPCYN
jgi:hypothetical protein